MDMPAASQPDRIRIDELSRLPGTDPSAFRISAKGVGPDDIAIEGLFRRDKLRPGLSLHVSDARERHGFVTQSVLPQSLSCIFFLKGEVGLTVGERDFAVGASGARPPRGFILCHTEPALFRRQSRDGQHVRHVVVTLTPEWLDLEGLALIEDRRAALSRSREQLYSRFWSVSPRLETLLEQAIAPPELVAPLRSLYLESRAIDIVTESLAALSGGDPAARQVLGRRDELHLTRAIAFVDANIDQPLTLDAIAREAGVSPSVLQRLFHARHDSAVFEFIRGRKLERACEALAMRRVSVAEAAAIAGYTSAANFATAFKRRYGLSPSALRVRGR